MPFQLYPAPMQSIKSPGTQPSALVPTGPSKVVQQYGEVKSRGTFLGAPITRTVGFGCPVYIGLQDLEILCNRMSRPFRKRYMPLNPKP